MKHIMIDCESFGLKLNSAITTIGAVEFDPYSTRLGPTFHQAIDLQSSLDSGLAMDAGAVLWWLAQPDASRKALTNKLENAQRLSLVLLEFERYLRQFGTPKEIKCWSCGMMDFVWLEHAYRSKGISIPWDYRVGDYRTIRDEFGLPGDEPHATTSHDALADAIWQAQYLQNVYRRLEKTA